MNELAEVLKLPVRYSENRDRELRTELLRQAADLLSKINTLEAVILARELRSLVIGYGEFAGADNVPKSQKITLAKESHFILDELGTALTLFVDDPEAGDIRSRLEARLQEFIEEHKI